MVTCRSSSCIRPSSRASSVSGLGIAPPKDPECTSPDGPRRSTWQSVMPRMPTHTVGVSRDHMPVSDTTTTSHPSSSRCARSSSAKCGEPDSSSPSTTSLRLTAGDVRPVAARCAVEAQQVEEDLALVVGRAAADEPVAVDHRLERVGAATARAA